MAAAMAPAIIPTTTTGGVSAGQPPPPQQQPANLDDPANVRRWLRTNHPRQLALLDDFEVGSRLGRTSASSSCSRGGGGDATVVGSSSAAGGSGTYRYGRERLPMAARTVELLRSIVGSTRWTNAAQLLTLLRGLGNELGGNGRRDPAIGNVIRRVMYAVRDEADRGLAEECDGDGDGGGAGNAVTAAGGLSGSRRESFLSSMLWAHPQQPVVNMGRHKREQSSGGGGGGGGDHGEVLRRMRSESFAGGGAEASSEYNTNPPSSHAYSTTTDGYYPPHYHARRDDLRPNVMEAIQEMMSELEDLHKNINEQALQHIHNGEIILTYAFSRTVELVSSGRSGASGRSRSNMFFVVLHRAHTLSHLLDRRAPDESPPPPSHNSPTDRLR
jgi:translation initiation factor eIF-2B subunit beta